MVQMPSAVVRHPSNHAISVATICTPQLNGFFGKMLFI
jgi:hypothetical protein